MAKTGNGATSAKGVPTSAIAQLNGPFRLLLEDGTDVTPKGEMRQALLALLLCATDFRRSRKFLRDTLWSSYSDERSSASLRNTLRFLRKDLSAIGRDVIEADRNAIGIRKDTILIDVKCERRLDFLEGINVGRIESEGFEDWLSNMRSAPVSIDEDGPYPDAWTRGRAENERPVALGLLSIVHVGLEEEDQLRCQILVDSMARYISETTRLDVHDLRDCEVQAVPLPLRSGRGPTHFLQMRAVKSDKKTVLTLRLFEGKSQKLVWVSGPILHAIEDASYVTAELAEMLLNRMASMQPSRDDPNLYPWTALTALFSLNERSIRDTAHAIDSLIRIGGPPELRPLRAFARVFEVNEGLISSTQIDPDDLIDSLAEIPDTHLLLPLCQSLVGYALHMLCGENEKAELLIERAFSTAPHLSLNLDHLAVLRLMRGDLEGAEEAHLLCQRVGTSSPWRYTYDVTGSMIAMAKGDYKSSLYQANKALLRKPRFIGALRYAMTGLALMDNADDAQRIRRSITMIRPNYDFDTLLGGLMQRAPPEFRSRLANSFEAHQLV